MWWLPNRNGYTRDRVSAGRYTFKQALQIVTDANQFCRRDELHETMCPADDSHLTLEFADHYVIQPTIQLWASVDFTVNKLGESGQPVEQGFEFHSGKNAKFLTIDEIVAFNHLAGV